MRESEAKDKHLSTNSPLTWTDMNEQKGFEQFFFPFMEKLTSKKKKKS